MLKHCLMLHWGKLVKMEAHKSSGTTKLIKCLCDVLVCRAMVCRSVFSRYPKWAVLAEGAKEWLDFPGPGALGSLAQAASGGTMPWCHHLVPFQCSWVCWDQQQARAPSHPVLPGLCNSSAHPRLLHWGDADGPELTHCSCALPGGRNGTMRDVGENFLFPPLAFPVIKDSLSQHCANEQAVSPGHIMIPGCLEEEKWKLQKNSYSWLLTWWLVPRISISQEGVWLPWAVQKCSVDTPDPTSICSMSADSLQHFTIK